jgi:ferredoxin-type protein NapF
MPIKGEAMTQISRMRLLRGGVKTAPPPLRPPWALRDARAFAQACDGCGKCVPACEINLIAPGSDGRPVVSFAETGCDFCGACADACPTGALERSDEAAPWDHVARIEASCLSFRGVECRMCGDHCPAGAIIFQPLVGGRRLPAVIEADCTGCGACVAPCPVQAVKTTPANAERGKACA